MMVGKELFLTIAWVYSAMGSPLCVDQTEEVAHMISYLITGDNFIKFTM